MTFPRMIVTETQKVAQTRCTSFLRQSEKYEILEAFLGGKKKNRSEKNRLRTFHGAYAKMAYVCYGWCHCTKKTSCTYSISLG